jgi:hypothetical protein
MDNQDTLALVLTSDSKSLGKVSSTCKKWHTVIGNYRDQEKMNYLKESSLKHQDHLLQNLEFEMYRCGTAYFDDDEFYYSWRDDTGDWEDEWYGYRFYSFFYNDNDHPHPLAHPHIWFLPR